MHQHCYTRGGGREDEILPILIEAVLSWTDSWNETEDYRHVEREWLASFLSLPVTIPSHDTFNRVFSPLYPAVLEASP